MNCANHPDRERVVFCQNCGRPLCQECARTVGQAVFCEPCLAAKLSAAASPTAPATPSSAYGYADPYNYTTAPVSTAPSPVLATILGFLPGVGAMYNGQYAKGVVHLIVFAMLVTLANQNGIFGLFIAGWIVYQAIEANHTARARVAGTPLPNPFGLNDLGERLGFGKAWPAAAPGDAGRSSNFAGPGSVSSVDAPQFTAKSPSLHGTAAPGDPAYVPPASYAPYSPPAAAWGAPAEGYRPESYATNYGYPPADASTYAPVNGSNAPGMPVSQPRFPMGAIWLIGLGVLFLIGNAGIFHGFDLSQMVPVFLIGVGVWLFVHKMTSAGEGLTDDGSPVYRARVFRALRGPVWIILVGLLFLLDSYGILGWGRSWPIFIIVAGLMAFLERIAQTEAAEAAMRFRPAPGGNAVPPFTAAPAGSVSEAQPAPGKRDEERS